MREHIIKLRDEVDEKRNKLQKELEQHNVPTWRREPMELQIERYRAMRDAYTKVLEVLYK